MNLGEDSHIPSPGKGFEDASVAEFESAECGAEFRLEMLSPASESTYGSFGPATSILTVVAVKENGPGTILGPGSVAKNQGCFTSDLQLDVLIRCCLGRCFSIFSWYIRTTCRFTFIPFSSLIWTMNRELLQSALVLCYALPLVIL